MLRIVSLSALVLLVAACVSAPRVGEPLAATIDCASDPLDFAIIDGRALHSCPYVTSAEGSYGAFAEVEQGVIRAVLDKPGARSWITSRRCAALGIELATQQYAACEELIADLMTLWDAVETAQERAEAAEQAVERAELRQRVVFHMAADSLDDWW